MKEINEDNIEVIIANAEKPKSLSNFKYPLNDLDDRVFEVLTYSIFKKRIVNRDIELEDFDNVSLMQGVGEKGMDCILTKEGEIRGIIQCKKYSKNLSDTLIVSELVKLALNLVVDKNIFYKSEKIKYFVATSTGFTAKALKLPQLLSSKSISDYYDIKSIILDTINKFKSFSSIIPEEVEKNVIDLILSLDYELVRPQDYDIWINAYPEIIETFFEIRKVIDTYAIERHTGRIINTLEKIFVTDDLKIVSDFIDKYSTAAIEKLNVINFIGFDLHRYRQKPTDITLTEVYVQPNFLQRSKDKSAKVLNVLGRELKTANLFKSERNIILLGDPGAGKSLLVKYIIVQLLSKKDESIGMKQFKGFVPFRIELRKYNEVREKKSIIEYLSDVLTKEYQISISSLLLDKLLTNTDSLIFFDGLDEIFNVNHKNKMKEYIESFSVNFPKSKCIVTSRFIGYHDIKFNSKKFDEFAFQRFNDKQIEELVTKFYSTQIQNLEKRRKLIQNCLNQIKKEVDYELKSNPLIMTLILILTSNNIVIPDSKLEIYEACTKTLVDTIDIQDKELNIEIPVKNKRLTFAHLAYWQYELLSKNDIVSYDKAIKSISQLLLDKKEVLEYSEAEEKAKKFLEYAEKRSIYFEDNFTHKTFLEYYTADFIYINFFTKASDNARKKVISLISTYLPKSFWYIVFELLLSRVDKEQADSELLDEIFSKQIESSSINVFYFFVSNLPKLINVSDDIKKAILKKTILLCIKGEKVTELKKEFGFEERSLLAKICLLQNNISLNNILQSVIFELEDSSLSEKDLTELYTFYYELLLLTGRFKIKGSIKIKNEAKCLELAYKDLNLFSQAVIPKKNTSIIFPISILKEQIIFFGKKSLFQEIKFKHRENVTRIDTFNYFFIDVIHNSDYENLLLCYNMLIENGFKHEEIIMHIKKSRIYFYHRVETFEKFINLYLKSNDLNIDSILIEVIKQNSGIKSAYTQYRQFANSPKLRTLDKLFNFK